MSAITILQTIPIPPIHIGDGDPHLRGFYSQRFLDSDNVTPVMSGNGQTGFYYDIQCETDGNGNLVIPQFVIRTTDDGIDVQSSLFSGQLYVNDAPNVIIFGNPSGNGWIIPASLGSSTTWDQLDVYNQGRALAFASATYLTAAETVALINSIPKGDSGYSGYSGWSGFSGISGYSGFSGISGYSGYSGISGYSGYSGFSGV